jgi:hypothetical protein
MSRDQYSKADELWNASLDAQNSALSSSSNYKAIEYYELALNYAIEARDLYLEKGSKNNASETENWLIIPFEKKIEELKQLIEDQENEKYKGFSNRKRSLSNLSLYSNNSHNQAWLLNHNCIDFEKSNNLLPPYSIDFEESKNLFIQETSQLSFFATNFKNQKSSFNSGSIQGKETHLDSKIKSFDNGLSESKAPFFVDLKFKKQKTNSNRNSLENYQVNQKPL